MPTKNYKSDYLKRLRDPKYFRGLLKSAFEESCADGNWQAFGLLLQDIVEAQGNKKQFAKEAKISRQHLYRLFSPRANPTLKTITPVLLKMGLKLTLTESELN